MVTKVKFPKDESKHKLGVEWWYFNGNLLDKKGNEYAFMKCLFKIDPKKAKIPFIKGGAKEHYFSHSLLCDIKKQKFFSNVHPLLHISRDSFPKSFYASYTIPLSWHDSGHKMEKIDRNTYHLINEFLNITLKSKTKPLLEEETGFIELNTDYPKTSYYYSLPNLEIKGRIFINNKSIEVMGQGWMDHQWSDSPFSFDKWNWFSVQLENNLNLMCVEYGDKIKDSLASIMHPNGSTFNTRKVKLVPKNKKWKSPMTRAEYPLEWEISIPEEKIEITATALIKNAEMIFGTINYWEGPVRFRGKVNGKPVKGKGFMELVGYPMHESKMQFFGAELKYKIKALARQIKSYSKLGAK